MRGYFQIGIYMPKTSENIGTLWRSAYQLGASGIFTIGKRYQKQSSDTYKVSLEAINQNSFNVSVAGSIVMYDRVFR